MPKKCIICKSVSGGFNIEKDICDFCIEMEYHKKFHPSELEQLRRNEKAKNG